MNKSSPVFEIGVVVVVLGILVVMVTATFYPSKKLTPATPTVPQNFTIASSERILYPYFTYVHVLKDNETNKEYILVVNDSIGMAITPKLKKD